VIEETVR